MDKSYHSVIIGGGCLGASTAISIAQNLNSSGKDVCIIEKGILCVALLNRVTRHYIYRDYDIYRHYGKS